MPDDRFELVDKWDRLLIAAWLLGAALLVGAAWRAAAWLDAFGRNLGSLGP